MKNLKKLQVLICCIIIAALFATTSGIFSDGGPGSYNHKSIRGKVVSIYGIGLYKDMSSEVAPQGIAQDYVTLFVAIPMLIILLFATQNGSLRARFLLAGTLGYFMVSYLFYLTMGMYNSMYLVYVLLLCTSFFSFILVLGEFDTGKLRGSFDEKTPVRAAGVFLVTVSLCIASLWLKIVVPPLLDGSVIPLETEHYTTLIVQGLDLGILLPAAIVIGILLIVKHPAGYLFAPVYLVFLSLLMTALSAKVIAMEIIGYNTMPAIIIIPVFNVLTILCLAILLKNIKHRSSNQKLEIDRAGSGHKSGN